MRSGKIVYDVVCTADLFSMHACMQAVFHSLDQALASFFFEIGSLYLGKMGLSREYRSYGFLICVLNDKEGPIILFFLHY